MAMLSLDNPTFERFAFYSGIAIGKTLLMSALTVRSRLTNKVRTMYSIACYIQLSLLGEIIGNMHIIFNAVMVIRRSRKHVGSGGGGPRHIFGGKLKKFEFSRG